MQAFHGLQTFSIYSTVKLPGIMFVVYVFLIVYCGTKLRRIRAKYEI